MARFTPEIVKVKVEPHWSFIAYWLILVGTFVAGFLAGRYLWLVDHWLSGPFPC